MELIGEFCAMGSARFDSVLVHFIVYSILLYILLLAHSVVNLIDLSRLQLE